MRSRPVPGTAGYEAEAATLVARYESVSFAQKYPGELDMLPAAPAQVLDIGAGTGADAAWFAARGDRVVAVEPTAAFRRVGAALHPSPAIEWVDDGLPALRSRADDAGRFDVVLMSAVWMHLDAHERAAAMPVVARLLAPGGLLLMSLRHGPVPVPVGRRMFDVGADETVALAAAAGLVLLRCARGPSQQPQNLAAGVEWTRLAWRAPRATTATTATRTGRLPAAQGHGSIVGLTPAPPHGGPLPGAPMPPALHGIDHVHVYVADRAAAEAWYARVLGLRRIPEFAVWADDGGPLTLRDADDTLHLALFQRAPQPNRSTVALRVDAASFAAWRRQLAEAGVAATFDDHGLALSLYFSDPDGNPYELTTYEHEAARAAL